MKAISLALAGLLALSAPAFANGDADKGEKLFKKNADPVTWLVRERQIALAPALNNIFGTGAACKNLSIQKP